MKAGEWIDRLRKKRDWNSDYRVAKELEIAASTLSRYRNKPESTMDDDTAIKVAVAMGERPDIVLLDQVVERTKSDAAKAALKEALKRLGGAVAGIVLAAGLASPSPAPAQTVPPLGDCVLRQIKRRDDEDESDEIEPTPEPLPDWLLGLWLFTNKAAPALHAN
jgi:hypothetical protein